MLTTWCVWGSLSLFFIFMSIYMEISEIKNKINGANGFVYFTIHLYFSVSVTIMTIITSFVEGFKIGILFFLISMIFIVFEVFCTFKLFDYYTNRGKK